MCEHREKSRPPLKDLLRESQLNLLNEWIEVNHIDKDTLNYEDNLLNGLRVVGTQLDTDENWEIDFTYGEEDEKVEREACRAKAWRRLRDIWETEVLGWELRDAPTGGNWQTVNVILNVKARKEPMELLDLLAEESS